MILSVLNLVVFLSFIFISSFDDILRDKLPKYIKEVKLAMHIFERPYQFFSNLIVKIVRTMKAHRFIDSIY